MVDVRGQHQKSQDVSSRLWAHVQPQLPRWILDAVESLGFDRMTPVQASTIPLFLKNKDVVVEAVTGSGKTLAFLIPLLERISRRDEPWKRGHVAAIVIAPTRELAIQIHETCLTLLSFRTSDLASSISSDQDTGAESRSIGTRLDSPTNAHFMTQLVVGGESSPKEDLRHFLGNSPIVLIATPGRLVELLKSPNVILAPDTFELLVLDEADRLLDLGFKNDLQKILARVPKQRRTGLFSASMSEALDQLIRVGLRNPVKVTVRVKSLQGDLEQRTPSSLSMHYKVVPPSDRLIAVAVLIAYLNKSGSKTIVYFSTGAEVDYFSCLLGHVFSSLDLPNFRIAGLHGKQVTKARHGHFKHFIEAPGSAILLATDVAARGLDIPQVDLVIQFDPPTDPKVFLHRCGRAGRAGRAGTSVVFLNPGHEENFVDFLKVRKTPISELPSDVQISSEENLARVTAALQKIILADRTLHDKGQRGFVSWVQAYSKHPAKTIFRMNELDWLGHAKAWALLKLPKMPELQSQSVDRSLGLDIDFANYQYEDPQKEHARKLALEKGPQEGRSKVASTREESRKRAWSDKLESKEQRIIRKERRQAKQEHVRMTQMTDAERQDHETLQSMLREVRTEVANTEKDIEFEGFDN